MRADSHDGSPSGAAPPRRRAVALTPPAGDDGRARYALGMLLDPLGLRLARGGEPADVTFELAISGSAGAAARPEAGAPPPLLRRALLDEAFAALTLAAEAGAPRDEHDRPTAPEALSAPPIPALVDEFAAILSAAGVATGARFAGGERFAVALTHDVDSLASFGLLAAARKTAISLAIRPRSVDARRRRREARAFLADARARRTTRYPLREMVAAEQEHGWRSTCYYLVRHAHPLDGPGDEYIRRLPAAVEAARGHGLEIGLHASYTARERPAGIAEEADRLAAITGERPRGLRHHYLRSNAVVLAEQIRLAGIEYDTSIGWAERPGPRAGTPYPYRLWDAELGAPGALELPLFVMDRTLERYLRLDPDQALAASVAALEPVAAAGGACAVLWHPPSHHPALSGGYDETYRRLLAWIADRGGFAGTALDVLERWQGRVPTTE